MKKPLGIASAVFGFLALVFYFSSIRSVGSMQVANMQATVFSGSCFVSAIVCGVGALVLGTVEDRIIEQSELIKSFATNKTETLLTEGTPKKNMVTPAIGKNTVENNPAVKKLNTDPAWSLDETGKVICPQCGSHMTVDFIKVRKKCPDCGREYKTVSNTQ